MEGYNVLDILGKGGYGKVVKCQSKSNRDFCAIKIFNHCSKVEMHLTMERELKLLKTLKHDNLVKLLEAFLENGQLYGVFELLDHSIMQALSEPRGRAGLDGVQLRKYTFQLLRGVDFLHNNNVIHRDIKPDNLLVSRSGVLKVADLGFSREVGDAAVCLSRGKGTLAYMAPEVLMGDANYCKLVDVWAIGCTIYGMAKGTFFLYGENALRQVHAIVREVGPLTVRQECQYWSYPKYAAYDLPKARLPAEPMVKFKLADGLLAQLVDMDPAHRSSCSQMLGLEYFTRDQFNQSFPKELADMVYYDEHGHLPQTPYQPLNSASVKAEDQEPSTLPTLKSHTRSLKESDCQQADNQAVQSPTPLLIETVSASVEKVEAAQSLTKDVPSSHLSGYLPGMISYGHQQGSLLQPLNQLMNNDSVEAEDQEPSTLPTLKSHTRSLKESDCQQADNQAVQSPTPLLIETVSASVEKVTCESLTKDVPSSHLSVHLPGMISCGHQQRPLNQLMNSDSEDQESSTLPTLKSHRERVWGKKIRKRIWKAFRRAAQTIRHFFTSIFSSV